MRRRCTPAKKRPAVRMTKQQVEFVLDQWAAGDTGPCILDQLAEQGLALPDSRIHFLLKKARRAGDTRAETRYAESNAVYVT